MAEPTSHRRAGQARVVVLSSTGEPSRPKFSEEVRSDFRLVLVSVIFPIAGMVWGVNVALQRETAAGWRIGAVVLALSGLLILSSYVLRFTTFLDRDAWQATPGRRVLRLVLRYSWHTYLAALGAVAVFHFVDWLAH